MMEGRFYKGLLITMGILIMVPLILYFVSEAIRFDGGYVVPQGYYNGMKEVNVAERLTFRVPEDWIVVQEDNIIHITDKPMEEDDYKYYLVGIITYEWGNDTELFKELFEEIVSVKYVQSYRHGRLDKRSYVSEFNSNGNLTEKHLIEFIFNESGEIRRVVLVAWDDLLDMDTIAMIARSKNPEWEGIPFIIVLFIVFELIIIILLIFEIRSQRREIMR